MVHTCRRTYFLGSVLFEINSVSILSDSILEDIKERPKLDDDKMSTFFFGRLLKVYIVEDNIYWDLMFHDPKH